MISQLKKCLLFLALLTLSNEINGTSLTITNKHPVRTDVEVQDRFDEKKSFTFSLEANKSISLNMLFAASGFSKAIYVIYGEKKTKFLFILDTQKSNNIDLAPK